MLLTEKQCKIYNAYLLIVGKPILQGCFVLCKKPRLAFLQWLQCNSENIHQQIAYIKPDNNNVHEKYINNFVNNLLFL